MSYDEDFLSQLRMDGSLSGMDTRLRYNEQKQDGMDGDDRHSRSSRDTRIQNSLPSSLSQVSLASSREKNKQLSMDRQISESPMSPLASISRIG